MFRSKLEKSLDLLNSSFNMNKLVQSPKPNFLQYNEEDRHKLTKAGVQDLNIEAIDSESDSYNPDEPRYNHQIKYEA